MGRRIRHISKEQLELLEDGADAATLEKLERGTRKRRAVCVRDMQVEYRGKRKVRRQPRKRKHRTS